MEKVVLGWIRLCLWVWSTPSRIKAEQKRREAYLTNLREWDSPFLY